MKLADFDYQLPEHLIAQYPLSKRTDSRLLKVDVFKHALTHHVFKELPVLLQPTDLLVFNDTKVLPARLYAHKPTGGKVEILLERILKPDEILAHCRASNLKPGHELIIDAQVKFEVLQQERLYHLKLVSNLSLMEVLNRYGHIPLPPYVERADQDFDKERYQTIYANIAGSAAAPTAGLHFDDEIFAALAAQGIEHTFVTLHVGAGTFQPVKTEDISKHIMHTEIYEINAEAAQKINEAKRAGRRVIAVGTTSVRTLETAAEGAYVKKGQSVTNIFIYPGYTFKIVDGMITNFHLPRSSLLMLVAAFAGLDLIKSVYELAIKESYRFFSYGDAMLLLR
jgi:S-adenosylmethionine:tRNA ribosyltransferase-isomerase